MYILVHNVHAVDAKYEYDNLDEKLHVLFSDIMNSRIDGKGFAIDIFNVHVDFRYGPLENIIGYRQPQYYFSDSAEALTYLAQRYFRTILRSIELCSISSIYNIIIQQGRKLQYNYDDRSIELRFKLLDIAQKHNFDLLFCKCEQYIGNEYRAIFKNNKQEIYEVLFDISCYPDWDEKLFNDLEEYIVRHLVDEEEDKINDRFDFGRNNVIDAIDKLKNAMNTAAERNRLYDDFNVNVACLYPATPEVVSSPEIVRSMAPFYGIPGIKKVIFNNPATIILWVDGTKTVVKAQDKDQFDKEKGLAMAMVKKALGNEGQYYEVIKKWLKEDEEKKTR